MLLRTLIVLVVCTTVLAVPAASAQLRTVTFDDVAVGPIGDLYLARGVRFVRGDGDHGGSTGPRLIDGAFDSAYVGSFGTGISGPNVLVPAPRSNDDIWVYFYDTAGNRTTSSLAGCVNDAEGLPSRVFIDAYDLSGAFIARAQIDGARVAGSVSAPEIGAVRISAAPGFGGFIGVDDFSYCLAVEVTSQPPDASTCAGGAITYRVEAAGEGPFSYLWQGQGAGSPDWTDITRDGPLVIGGREVGTISGTDTATVTVRASAEGSSFAGVIRVIVLTPCGAAASEPALLRVCAGDYNCDGGVDGADVDAFFADWSEGLAASDINDDGGVDGADVQVFFDRWEGGC